MSGDVFRAKPGQLRILLWLVVLLACVLCWPYIEALPRSVFRSQIVSHARIEMVIPRGWEVSRIEDSIKFSRKQFSVFGSVNRSVGLIQIQPPHIGRGTDWLARTRTHFEGLAAPNSAPRFIQGNYGSFQCFGYQSSQVPTQMKLSCLDDRTGLTSTFVGTAFDIEEYFQILTRTKASVE